MWVRFPLRAQSKHYWPLGPLPAVILMPYVAVAQYIFTEVDQALPQIILVGAIGIIVFLLARKLSYRKIDSLFLSLAFCAGTMFLPIAFESSSWYFSHVVTVIALFLAIYEFYSRKRYWLIGTYLGLALLTRLTAAIGVIFFALELFFNSNLSRKKKVRSLLLLILPLVIAFAGQCLYNYARFGNPLESGYGISLLTDPTISANRQYGLFSLKHVPGNLFYMLVRSPVRVLADDVSRILKFPYIQADIWGMSIFYTSLYLLSLFLFKYKEWTSKNLIVTIVLISLPIITYYGIGATQIGYRYALDFMPFVFLLFMREYKSTHERLSGRMIAAILVSCLFNYYIFFATYYLQ
jgi:hypothetical protein